MASPSAPYATGFGSLGSQVRAPMPAGSYSDLDNNAAPASPSTASPSNPHAPTYASPKARLAAAKMEMTPEERQVIDSIQATSFRAQMFGLGVGAGLGYALTKRKFPAASWVQLAAPMIAGAFMSPLWSMPLAYFLSKPQMSKLEGDEHLKSIITQSQQRNVPLRSVPVSAQAEAPAPAETSPELGRLGASTFDADPYASPASPLQSTTPAAATGPGEEDAWTRLRRQAVPQAPGSAASSGSAWDSVRKGQTPSYGSVPLAGAGVSDANGDYVPSSSANAWGDAPTSSLVRT